MTRQLRTAEIKPKERPLAERFRLAGKAWAAAKRDADITSEMKSAFLEKMKTRMRDELVAKGEKEPSGEKLERLAKSSPEWEEYIRGMCFAKEKEDDAWVERKAIEMEMSEQVDGNANYRTERKMA